MRPTPDPVGPGQESVWDYPRPPRLEPTPRRIRIQRGDVVLVDTVRALRLLETSHPPTYYLPPDDIDMARMHRAAGRSSFCEWKGQAHYYDLRPDGGDAIALDGVAWAYANPVARFAALKDHLAFYPHEALTCLVDDEIARPQPGGFYGGWITSDLAGPFKGSPGTMGW
ncbi:MAG: DUF427 domain-containing protein [Acidobacteriota bacterium]